MILRLCWPDGAFRDVTWPDRPPICYEMGFIKPIAAGWWDSSAPTQHDTLAIKVRFRLDAIGQQCAYYFVENALELEPWILEARDRGR